MMIELDPDSVWSHDEPSICSENWKSQEGPTLSNDIWSKFDLLLTPPRTPLRDADCIDLGSLPEDLNIGAIDLPLLEEDDLEVNLDFLDLDVNLPLELTGVNTIDFTPGVVCSHGQVRDTCTSCEKLALAGSELRHDCMWIGTCTAEAHANQKNRIHHDSSCSHISDLLLSDSHGSLEVVTRFTQLDDFRDHEDDDDDDSQLDQDDDALDCNPMPRPDTPSESSETDSDEELDKPRSNDYDVHEEIVYTSGSPSSTGVVHSDHTYHCMPPPSPKGRSPVKSQTHLVPSYLHTPSDSEDEIDVVSVGGNSKESAYSCSTRPVKRSSKSSSNGSGGKKKNRNMVLSCTAEGAKKIFRIHTSTTTLPSTSLRSSKKVVHESPAECVKLKARKGSGKATKRLLQQQQQQRGGSGGPRKRGSPRADADDPDKREIHNSLERLRRVDLRNAFEELRVLIPDLVGKEKAPKVEILKKAAQYCHVIQEEERNFLAQIERERKYNSNLIKRLHALQRR